jgi:hypothetical protein
MKSNKISDVISAGNLESDFNFEETLRNDHYLSNHLAKHQKPLTDKDFGYYLAGLIEGDGYIGERRIEIAFHREDIQSAYYIKKRLAYGSVLILKNKKSVRYVCKKLEGLKLIYNFINGKLLGEHKINQLIKHEYNILFSMPILTKASFNLLTNHWLAGFSDADGSFGIFMLKSATHKTGTNVILTYRIKQKYPELLELVKLALGGNIYIFKDGMYSYSSTNFKIAKKVADYFDKYHLLNTSKWLNYIKWRKVYRMIQRKEHLTHEGINKILKIKKNLSNQDHLFISFEQENLRD